MIRPKLSISIAKSAISYCLILLVFCISVFVTACSAPEKNVNNDTKTKTKVKKDLLKEASILGAQDKNLNALALYKKALNTDSIVNDPARYAEALSRAARILVMERDYEEAAKLTRKCLEAWENPELQGDERAEVLVCIDDLGQAYLEKAKGKNEIDCLEQAIKLLGKPFDYKNTQYFRSLPRLSSAYLFAGNREKSDEYKELAIKSESCSMRDIIDIAVANKIMGQNENAKQLLTVAQKKSKHSSMKYVKSLFLYKLSKKLLAMNYLDRAEKVLLKITKSPNSQYKTQDLSNAYEQLAYVNESKGHIKKAINCFKMSIKEQRLKGPRQKHLRRRLESFYRFAKRNNLEALANELDVQIQNIRESDKETKKLLY